MTIATLSNSDCTTLAPVPVNPSNDTLFPKDLATLQQNFGLSCSRYETLTEKKLARSDTIIVSGFGCSLSVRGDALRVYPGKTHKDQTQEGLMLYRGVHGIRQIILITKKGEITLDAIQFCKDQDISIIMLDNRGDLIQSLSPDNLSDAKLRRSQYAALENGQAGKISCELVRRKIVGQLETLQRHTKELPGAREAINVIESAIKPFGRKVLPSCYHDIPWLRTYEGRIANAYFESWYDLPIQWDNAVKKIVPPHWQVVTERTSPLSKNHGARWAVNPFHAMLNYAYAVLESQTKQALQKSGLDLACGFLHSDKLYRDSLVYDVMECHRPSVDHLVLKLLATTTFRKGDLMTTNDGTVKFNPQLCRYIAASCKLTQAEIDASAMWLKSCLG